MQGSNHSASAWSGFGAQPHDVNSAIEARSKALIGL